ncbi:uncharacterized protein GGS22DRAFT_138134 [Annulohypoxylon maeteangense]|uniref:uncharacterized protein n=1 Tax=Annulohypoxylon maeteangense TaxID=1927788 RepID=UPI002007FA62|nr:uncharacterized protein GGS22DRAFT_138134 [Annulohypoxylon maeteangense]KAI0885070.1 hypothetical protein GGS22DRAFT_138134 [Annulohypoxylon maeteangense]
MVAFFLRCNRKYCICRCGGTFSRPDALTRHIKGESKDAPKHLCDKCGIKSFSRKDHLTQHQKSCRGRKIGNQPGGHEAEPLPLATIPGPSVLVNENDFMPNQDPPFPCLITGRDKWGPKGYVRLRDLNEHQGWAHPFMPQNLSTMSQFSENMQSRPQFNNTSQVYQHHDVSQDYQLVGGFQPSLLNIAPQVPKPLYDPPFPCLVMGCDKWGPNGYVRLQDLSEHQGWAHPFMVQNLGTMSQFSGDMQLYQPINNTQFYQTDNASQVYQHDDVPQDNQHVASLQFPQPTYDPQFQWPGNIELYGQDSVAQSFPADGSSLALQPEIVSQPNQQGNTVADTADTAIDGNLDDTTQVYQQNGAFQF